MRVLTVDEVTTLEALGEVLVPGITEAGIANYVDHQLSSPVDRQLLIIRYFGVTPPFENFYREGLAALDRAGRAVCQSGFRELDTDWKRDLVGRLGLENPRGWDNGPPALLFFLVVRSDALNGTYGTIALRIPYLAHIIPPSGWGE